MTLLPVVAREMSVLARRQSTYWSRAATAVIAVLTMLWLLLVSATRVSLAELGSSIFLILSSFCFGFALLIGMQATSDSVSEEKREGTLGLLFLTDLRAIHIILGKLAASSLNALFAVLGVVPMLALAMLLGGVTLKQVGLVGIILLNSMFLSLSLGIFVSTLSKNERKAMFACFVGLFVITLLPFILAFGVSDFEKVHERFVFVSPLYSFMCAHSNPTSALNTSYLIPSLIFQHLLAWGLLIRASAILPNYVNELPPGRFLKFRSFVENFVFGRANERKRYRARMLDRNAFLWLASREQVKPKYAWGIVAFFGLLFLWVFQQFPNMVLDPPVPLTIIFLVHVIFKLWVGSEVCSRLIQDRRSGALELLLSSPLSVRDIAQGQNLALQRVFYWPTRTLVAAELILMLFIVRSGRASEISETVVLYLAAASTLLLDLWAIKWLGLWLSLFGKSIERVLIQTLACVLGIPWVLFGVVGGLLGATVALQSQKIPATLVYSLWWIISAGIALVLGWSAQRKFLRFCREAVSEQFTGRAFKNARETKTKALATGSGISAATGILELARRRWIVCGVALILVLTFGAALGRQLYWKRQVTLEFQRIRDAGQPASTIEIGRFVPPLPFHENAFPMLDQAGAVNLPGRMQFNYAAQLTTRLSKREDAVLQESSALLSSNSAQMEALGKLLKFEKGYVDPNLKNDWLLQVQLGGYIHLATADLILALDARDASRVETDLVIILRLARLLRQQPLRSLQNVCHQTLTVFDSALKPVLDSQVLNGTSLLRVQLELEKVDSEGTLPRTLSVERARLIGFWGEVQRDSFGANNPPMLISAAHGLLHFVGSYDQDLARTLQSIEKARNIPLSLRSKALNDEFAKTSIGGGLANFPFFGKAFVNQISAMISTDTGIMARLEILKAALAAERFRLKYNSFPTTMQMVLPEFLGQLPVDPYTGKEFECVETNGLFIIGNERNSKDGITLELITFRRSIPRSVGKERQN